MKINAEKFIEQNKAIDDLAKKGNYFKDKIDEITKEHPNLCEFSGAPWMPYMTFIHDENNVYKKNRKQFFTEMIRRKVFWQPYHHSYFCYRHSYDDIDYVVNCVDESLKAISRN